MAHTYIKLYYHLIFAPKYRIASLDARWRQQLHTYIAGVIKNKGHFPLAVGGTADHIHILMSAHSVEGIDMIVKDIKIASTKWINDHKLCRGKFSWQEGYCAFSYSLSLTSAVANYINNQEEHHKKISFAEELQKIFEQAELEFEEKYMLHEPR